MNSQRLFWREYDFPKTFSLNENQFSGKIYFYTIASSAVAAASVLIVLLSFVILVALDIQEKDDQGSETAG